MAILITSRQLSKKRQHKGKQKENTMIWAKDRESFLSEIFFSVLCESSQTSRRQSDVSWCLFVESSQCLKLLRVRESRWMIVERQTTSWFGDNIYGVKCIVGVVSSPSERRFNNSKANGIEWMLSVTSRPSSRLAAWIIWTTTQLMDPIQSNAHLKTVSVA